MSISWTLFHQYLRNRRKTSDNGEPKENQETEKDIAAKEAASSQVTETDITSPKLTLASEVTAINVDQLDIVPSIPEETDEKPVIRITESEKKDSKKIKKKSKKRTKSKKTKETEKDIAAKEAASSQIPETDITSPNLALASEVTAINVDQLDIVPSIAEETDKNQNGYYITELALASEVTAINVDQLDIVPSIPEETDEKPVITDEPK
ncbi:Zonadhesin, partial [Trichinella spiralis]